ncbi:hypothetical protein BH10ACI1_BH10ACI1_02700 [soil metagenome]
MKEYITSVLGFLTAGALFYLGFMIMQILVRLFVDLFIHYKI